MNATPAPAAAQPKGGMTGVAMTGGSVGVVALLQWIMVCLGLPVMPTDAALGLVTVLAGIAHLTDAWLARRRAAPPAQPAGQPAPTAGETTHA